MTHGLQQKFWFEPNPEPLPLLEPKPEPKFRPELEPKPLLKLLPAPPFVEEWLHSNAFASISASIVVSSARLIFLSPIKTGTGVVEVG